MKYLTEVEGTKACSNSDFFLLWLHGFGNYKSFDKMQVKLFHNFTSILQCINLITY